MILSFIHKFLVQMKRLFFQGGNKLVKPTIFINGEQTKTPKELESIQNQPYILFTKQNNLFEYNMIKENKSFFRKAQILLYNFDLVNLSHYFVNNPTQKTVLYVTCLNYDIVTAIPKSYVRSQFQSQTDPYLKFLNEHNFTISSSYIDIHPQEAHIKLCRLLNLPVEREVKDKFRLSFGSKINKKLFYDDLKKISENLLVKGQIKSRRMERKDAGKPISEIELIKRKQLLSAWVQQVMSDLKAISTSDQLIQLDWVEKAKYYEQTNISDYLENHKPKESSYGMFIPPSDDLNL